jgi:hypothetical protein
MANTLVERIRERPLVCNGVSGRLRTINNLALSRMRQTVEGDEAGRAREDAIEPRAPFAAWSDGSGRP